MRTTVTIDDQLLGQAKARAAETGKTLNAVVEDALRASLARQRDEAAPAAKPLPTFAGSRLLPGVDLDDSGALLQLMDEAET